MERIAHSIDVVKQLTEEAAPRLGTRQRVVSDQIEAPRNITVGNDH